MKLDLEQMRLEARDRQLAISIGRQMVEDHFKPERIEDMRDVREQVARAAEHAAYEAIQRERALHAEDMAMLRETSRLKTWLELVAPARPIVIEKPDV